MNAKKLPLLYHLFFLVILDFFDGRTKERHYIALALRET